MRYPQFERLILGFGGIAILAAAVLSVPGSGVWQEYAGQAFLFVVLGGALHWGRRGGFVAAVLASIAYILLRLPLLVASDVTAATLLMLVSRLAAYGLVGIMGGETFGRIKYMFMRLEDRSLVDDWSRVYNQRFAAQAVTAALARHKRYNEAFSVVIIKLAPALMSALSPRRQRSIVRGMANHIRNDVRVVDEVARLDDGRFLVLLPHTPKEGAAVVADRLGEVVRQAVGAAEGSVTTSTFAAREDFDGLQRLAEELAEPYADDPEYSSAAESTRYPAERRASSADASVLRTSMAEPDATSKQ